MKKYFTGEVTPPRKRVTTCQKCIRTGDIDNVGITDRHGTFFEMLGNFSFGDYFKHEATAWAWEFCTKVMEMPVDKLWVTIYLDDDEAYDIWTKEVGVDPSHIVRLGKEDNFWEHGPGACGPCSEIYFDRGPEHGCGKPTCGPGCDCDRYVEFWNVVFSQFNSDGEGHYPPLEHPNIDTGMGLERLACRQPLFGGHRTKYHEAYLQGCKRDVRKRRKSRHFPARDHRPHPLHGLYDCGRRHAL